MTVPFIYIALLISWVIIIVAFYLDDWTMKSLISLFFMTAGVLILKEGVEGIRNIAVDALGITHIAIGAYVIITESFKLYKDM